MYTILAANGSTDLYSFWVYYEDSQLGPVGTVAIKRLNNVRQVSRYDIIIGKQWQP